MVNPYNIQAKLKSSTIEGSDTKLAFVTPGDLLTGLFNVDNKYQTRRVEGTRDWLLIYTLSGAGRFCQNQKNPIISHPGDLVLIRPGTPQDYSTDPETDHWQLLWTHFRPKISWLQWMHWPEQYPGCMMLKFSEPLLRKTIEGRLRACHRYATGLMPHHTALAMNALEEVLLWCDSQISSALHAGLDSRVRLTMDYITDHLAEKLTVPSLASLSGISESSLSRLFQKEMGITPQQFLEQHRIERARQLLARTSLSITTIAREIGFDNPFYFSLRFKHQSGLSPSEWRRQAWERDERN